MRVGDVAGYLRTMERAIVAALAEAGVAARSRGAEGRDSPASGWSDRKIASIGVHISRGVSAHGFAVNVDNDLAAVHVGRALRAAERAHDLARRRRGRPTTWRASAGGWPRVRAGVRPPPAARDPAAAGHRRAPADRYAGRVSEAPLRIHQTRSRANPGGMDVSKVLGSETQPFRGRKPPWFKVPLPGGPKYRELAR